MQQAKDSNARESKYKYIFSYSQMFKRREQENLIDFELKEKTLSFTRDCCCPHDWTYKSVMILYFYYKSTK